MQTMKIEIEISLENQLQITALANFLTLLNDQAVLTAEPQAIKVVEAEIKETKKAVKASRAVKEEPKQEEPKQEEAKQEEPKQEEPKQEEPKQEEPKQEEPKQEETKQEETKQEVDDNILSNKMQTVLQADPTKRLLLKEKLDELGAPNIRSFKDAASKIEFWNFLNTL